MTDAVKGRDNRPAAAALARLVLRLEGAIEDTRDTLGWVREELESGDPGDLREVAEVLEAEFAGSGHLGVAVADLLAALPEEDDDEEDDETIDESIAALERDGLIETSGELRGGQPVYRLTEQGRHAVRENEGEREGDATTRSASYPG